MGRTPVIASLIRTFLPKDQLLSYLEAIMRIYNRYGRRDNIYKARIKILVRALGSEEFTRQVEEEWVETRKTGINLPAEEEQRIRKFFTPPSYETLSVPVATYEKTKIGHTAFARWVDTNVHPHKIPGYAAVTLSLKPIGGIPGDATAEQMEGVAELAEQYSFGEVRVTHIQNLVLADVKQSDLFAIWQNLSEIGFATANVGLVSDTIACPGLDYCSLANARSIPISQRISERFEDLDRQYDVGPLQIKISGCINACGHHHAGHIGILGVDRNGKELYQVTLGGAGDETASVGKLIGPGFTADEVIDVVEKLVNTYLELRDSGETFLEAYRRVGVEPFKERVYASR